jgi:hypothetical protein
MREFTYQVVVFSKDEKDWVKIAEFKTESAAQDFVDDYPRFGMRYSSTIRAGNWQIINE